jgi:hypothetical protein
MLIGMGHSFWVLWTSCFVKCVGMAATEPFVVDSEHSQWKVVAEDEHRVS